MDGWLLFFDLLGLAWAIAMIPAYRYNRKTYNRIGAAVRAPFLPLVLLLAVLYAPVAYVRSITKRWTQ